MEIGSVKKIILASLAWICLMGSPLVTEADTYRGQSKVGVSVVENKGGGRIPPPTEKPVPPPAVVGTKGKAIEYRAELPQTSEKQLNFGSVTLGVVLTLTPVGAMIAKRRRGNVQT